MSLILSCRLQHYSSSTANEHHSCVCFRAEAECLGSAAVFDESVCRDHLVVISPSRPLRTFPHVFVFGFGCVGPSGETSAPIRCRSAHHVCAGTEPDTSLDLFVLLRSCQTLSRLWPASRLCKETFGPILSVNTWECLCTRAVGVCYKLHSSLSAGNASFLQNALILMGMRVL